MAEFDYVVVSASSWFYRPSMLYEAGRLVGCHYCKLPNVTDAWPRGPRCGRCPVPTAAAAGSAARPCCAPWTGEWSGDGNCVRTAPYRRGQKRIEGFEHDFRAL